MSYICTVVFAADLENLERTEREHPEIINGIMEAATGRMLSHTRYVRDGFTMDVDEYESEAVYEEFISLVGHLIAQYGELCGAAPVDTLWKRL